MNSKRLDYAFRRRAGKDYCALNFWHRGESPWRPHQSRMAFYALREQHREIRRVLDLCAGQATGSDELQRGRVHLLGGHLFVQRLRPRPYGFLNFRRYPLRAAQRVLARGARDSFSCCGS